jgi:hypothetical protein
MDFDEDFWLACEIWRGKNRRRKKVLDRGFRRLWVLGDPVLLVWIGGNITLMYSVIWTAFILRKWLLESDWGCLVWSVGSSVLLSEIGFCGGFLGAISRLRRERRSQQREYIVKTSQIIEQPGVSENGSARWGLEYKVISTENREEGSVIWTALVSFKQSVSRDGNIGEGLCRCSEVIVHHHGVARRCRIVLGVLKFAKEVLLKYITPSWTAARVSPGGRRSFRANPPNR